MTNQSPECDHPVTEKGDMTDQAPELLRFVEMVRALLRYTNPCNVAKDHSQQWQAVEHECSKIETLVTRPPSERPEDYDDMPNAYIEASRKPNVERPVAQVAWSEEERRAIAHVRYQVDQASPEKPDCCFDFDLVKDLLRVIDQATPHEEPGRETMTSVTGDEGKTK